MPGPSEASGSRLLPPLNTQLSRTRSRGRSEGRTPVLPPPSALGSTVSARKVRTVPPSAVFEPPDPPSPPHLSQDPDPGKSNSPNQTQSSVPGTTTPRRRPRPRLRYSTSSEGTSDDTSDSDDPPWWTFTNKGMNKLRNRTLGISSRGNSFTNQDHAGQGENAGVRGVMGGNESAIESSAENNGRPRLRTRFASRKNSRIGASMGPHTDEENRPRLRWKNSRQGSDSRPSNDGTQGAPSIDTPVRSDSNSHDHSLGLFHRKSSTPSLSIPGLFVTRSGSGSGIDNSLERPIKGRKRSAESGNQSDSGLVIRRVFKRSNSAPGSPLHDLINQSEPETTIAGIIAQSSSTFPSNRLLSASPDNSLPPSPSVQPESTTSNRPGKRRQMTSPALNRFRKVAGKSNTMDPFLYRRSTDQGRTNDSTRIMNHDNMSDSEAHMSASPRVKAKVRILGSKLIHSRTSNLNGHTNNEDEEEGDGDGGDTPGENGTPNVDQDGNKRPRNKRLNSHKLRIQLPPRLDQHLHQWPHAGSWQDALYGYYEEDENAPTRDRKKDVLGAGRSKNTRKMTGKEEGGREREKSGETLVNKDNNTGSAARETGPSQPQTPRIVQHGAEAVEGSATAQRDKVTAERVGYDEKKRERKKSRRSRRYRQALMPPTPQGLGFDTRSEDDENEKHQNQNRQSSHQSGFNWNRNTNENETIMENDDLSRTETRVTSGNAPTEKSDSLGKSSSRRLRIGAMAGKRRRGRLAQQQEKTLGRRKGDWKVRWKRILFLDARLTILIRLVDLAVVATLLALAITIRLELQGLDLPGMIGSSTTITISFASFTLLHGMTAIYREYFGKPIGLWALRSKMLWVCLDLLFVALWSASLSLSINDYISTPLECSPYDPWWFKGLFSSYENLLSTLYSSQSTSTNGSGDGFITPVDFIKATLGIILPEQIVESGLAHQVCYRQRGCIALSLFSLLLYAGNMVLSLFRIFETVRRTANVSRAVGMA